MARSSSEINAMLDLRMWESAGTVGQLRRCKSAWVWWIQRWRWGQRIHGWPQCCPLSHTTPHPLIDQSHSTQLHVHWCTPSSPNTHTHVTITTQTQRRTPRTSKLPTSQWQFFRYPWHWRAMAGVAVRISTGMPGLYLASRRAVAPVWVKQMI